MSLKRLFDAELAYQAGAEPVIDPDGREGVLIGSGDGTVSGPELRGSIHWSMYTADCPYRPDGSPGEGEPTSDGDHCCRTNPGGFIETDDGAKVWFDVKGLGLRRQDLKPAWRLTGSLRFQTKDERYAWLNRAIGLWGGRFDEAAGVGSYSALLSSG